MRSHENNLKPVSQAERDTLDANQTVEPSASELTAGWEAPPAPALSYPGGTVYEIADDALIALPDAEKTARRPALWSGRGRLWLGLIAAAVAVPVGLTLASAVTSPPHVAGVPSGHLVTLQADAPSEHTTTLRGLFVSSPGGATRLLTHETEPQDTDGTGVREWITQPAISPDGTRLAFEEQQIALHEDKQTIDNQIWVMPLTAGTEEPPHLVLDLTKQLMKQIIGLAWDSDSSLLLLEDGTSYSVPTDAADPPLQTPPPLKTPLDLHGLLPLTTRDLSATRLPSLADSGTFAYVVQTASGPQVLASAAGKVVPGPAAEVYALSPDGQKIAFVGSGATHAISVYDLARHAPGPDIPARWGWSVFGGRAITSLHWSPDGAMLAYTVSKPPVPEDELFAVTLATGKTVQLPYRTGRAAWDWGK